MLMQEQKQWVKVLMLVFLGVLAMGNAKYSIIQLVAVIAEDLQVGSDEILSTVAAYFWGAFFGAPILALCCRHWDKRRLLTMLAVWCFLGNLLSSFAPNAQILYWLRWLSGMPHGLFLAVALMLVAEHVPAQQRGRYVGWALSGMGIAMLFFIPFNAWIGELYGWRVPFRFVALMDVLMVLLVHDLLPENQESPIKTVTISFKEQWQWLQQKHIVLYLLMTLCTIIAMTCVWSFGLNLLHQQSAMPLELNTVLLVMLGAGFLISQVLGGYLADWNLPRSLSYSVCWNVGILLVLWWALADYRWALFCMSGVAMMSVIHVLVQMRFLDMPPMNLYLLLSVYNSTVQLANFIGASFGIYWVNPQMNAFWLLPIALVWAVASCGLWWLTQKLDSNYLIHLKTKTT